MTPKGAKLKITGLKPGTYQVLVFSNYPLYELVKMEKMPEDLEQRTYFVVDGHAVLVGNRHILKGAELAAFDEKVKAMLYGNPRRCAARSFGSKAGIRYGLVRPPEMAVQQKEAVPEVIAGGEDVSLRIS
jgi:hypothetical protein